MADNYNQIYTYILYSFGIGILLGVIYDVFRIIRMAFTLPGLVTDEYKGRAHRSRFSVNCIVFICDILFFLIAAVISAIFIFYVNNGRIRGIAIFGSLCGFVLYYNTVGRLVTMISGSLIRLVCHIFHFVGYSVLLPIFKGSIKALLWLWHKAVFLENRFYTRRCERRIIRRIKH